MSSSLFRDFRDEIETHIQIDFETTRIVYVTSVVRFQIDKMKLNLIKYNNVVVSHQAMKLFKKINAKIKKYLLKYIDLRFIKYLNEMC